MKEQIETLEKMVAIFRETCSILIKTQDVNACAGSPHGDMEELA